MSVVVQTVCNIHLPTARFDVGVLSFFAVQARRNICFVCCLETLILCCEGLLAQMTSALLFVYGFGSICAVCCCALLDI